MIASKGSTQKKFISYPDGRTILHLDYRVSLSLYEPSRIFTGFSLLESFVCTKTGQSQADELFTLAKCKVC